MSDFQHSPATLQPSAAPAGLGESTRPFHHGLISRLRNYFLTGLVLVGPLYITVSLTWWFINWVDDLVRPFIPVAYRPETYLPVKVSGIGLIIVLVTLTLLGFLTANFVGISQLCELFRTRCALGILVLGPVRHSRVDRGRFD